MFVCGSGSVKGGSSPAGDAQRAPLTGSDPTVTTIRQLSPGEVGSGDGSSSVRTLVAVTRGVLVAEPSDDRVDVGALLFDQGASCSLGGSLIALAGEPLCSLLLERDERGVLPDRNGPLEVPREVGKPIALGGRLGEPHPVVVVGAVYRVEKAARCPSAVANLVPLDQAAEIADVLTRAKQ